MIQKVARRLHERVRQSRRVPEHLPTLRNESVFHFDEDVLAKRLAEVGNDFVVFMSAVGDYRGAINYELADMTAVQAMMGEPAPETSEEYLEKSLTTC